MISLARRLPAASILQVSTIAVRRAIDIDHRNTAMQFFYMKRTVSFYFIDYYSADRRALGQKVCFFSEYLCFFLGRCIESTRTDPSYPPIYFSLVSPESSSCFGMISDEGSVGAIVMVVVDGEKGV